MSEQKTILHVLQQAEDGRLPSQDFRELEIIEGGLNRNIIFQYDNDESVSRFVLRTPKSPIDRAQTEAAIQREYDAIGATLNGVGFRLRSVDEQMHFLSESAANDLKTPRHVRAIGESMVMEFVEGMPLSSYVQEDPDTLDFRIVENVLIHMKKAHAQGIVFGDRWVKNTMVLPTGDFVELDFDIELIGEEKTIATFELSQTLFHLIHFAGDRGYMLNALTEFYAQNPIMLEGYDNKKLHAFMKGQADYFTATFQQTGELYEGLVPPYLEIMLFLNDLEHMDVEGSTRRRASA